MKIAILSLRLLNNYGGILQTFALRTILTRLGHNAYFIERDHDHHCYFSIFYLRRIIRKYILRKNMFLKISDERKHISKNTQKFIEEYIPQRIHCKQYNKLPINCVDAIIVGSDQVWRPMYFGNRIIQDAYLAFTHHWNIKRIAYAASFGTDCWEYTKTQTRKCKKAISNFDAVSVREDSAVGLCQKHFNITAKYTLDPTLLLSKQDYINLANKAEPTLNHAGLMVYILDKNPDKQLAVNKIAEQQKLTAFEFEDNKRVSAPVEQWIRGFMDAEFVITDSFHACIFSIIFNKPFIAYLNQGRGSARFQSLLSMFNLDQRLIHSAKDLDSINFKTINWKEVNQKLDTLKKDSLEFITEALQ